MKQLDPRWARKGVTTALLKAAGYSTDVAVKTEFAGDLPAHLSCWSPDLGRSDVTVAKVAAPASDPSLRKLPRSIQFQGISVSISVSRSLQNRHEQRKARQADSSGKPARSKARRVESACHKLHLHARIDGFRAVALETGCHRGLVVMWLSRSGWDVTSVTETVPETMH